MRLLNWDRIFAALLMIVLVGCGKDESRKLEVNVQPSVAVETAKEVDVQPSVAVETAKELVISSAKELKGVKAKKIIWKKDGAKMVRIPTMASKQVKTFNRVGEPIVKTVKVDGPDSIYMDTTEVTVGQFKKFLESTDHQFDGDLWAEVYEVSPTGKYPMVNVTWHDATAYAKWVGKRLPTEKEWEFAARGGLVGKEFPWGDDEAVARDYANYKGIRGKDKWEYCAPVGSFRPNGYGLFDMSGNVFEWCQGWVVRGGSWGNYPDFLRAAFRGDSNPAHAFSHRGFRCVSGFPAAQQ